MKKVTIKLGVVAVVIGLAVALSGQSLSAAEKSKGILDGKVFVGQIGDKGSVEGAPETITFKDGKFHSSACDDFGFGDGAYKAETKGDATMFTAETTNAKGAKIQWSGMIKDDKLEAKSVMIAPGEKPSESVATGVLKK